MNIENIILWREGRGLMAAEIETLEEKVTFKGLPAAPMGTALGDYDILRSALGEMLGFDFGITKRQIEVLMPMFDGLDWVAIDSNRLRIQMEPCPNVVTECVQGSSWIMGSRGLPVAIFVHKWIDWGTFGFPLHRAPVEFKKGKR